MLTLSNKEMLLCYILEILKRNLSSIGCLCYSIDANSSCLIQKYLKLSAAGVLVS